MSSSEGPAATAGAPGWGQDTSTPGMFRSFLEISGDRVVPTTLSKATLDDLNHALEDLVRHEGGPGTLLVSVQDDPSWQLERARYESLPTELAPLAATTDDRPAATTSVHRFRLDSGERSVQESFLIALTDRFSAAVFGRELVEQAVPAEDMERRFVAVWTFDGTVVADVCATLHGVCRTLDARAAHRVEAALAAHPPRDPDAILGQRFANAVFERLEQGRQRWRRALVELASRVDDDAVLPVADAQHDAEHDADHIAEHDADHAADHDADHDADHARPPEPDGDVEVTPDDDGVPSPRSTTPRATGASGRALVVDEEPAIRGLLEALLRRAGWDVVAADGRGAAIAAAEQHHLDVALLDVTLDDASGTAVLDALDAVQPGLRARSAFLTGAPPRGGMLEGRPVLGKPFVWAQLADLLDQLTSPGTTTPEATTPDRTQGPRQEAP
ncbi:MAG: DICT sensory domain-containing protein [Actinomycetota bacterium]